MMTFLLALQTDTVAFSGGNAEQFVRALARQHVAPAVVFADPKYRFKSVLGVPRKNFTAKAIAKEVNGLALGSTFALTAKELPSGFLLRSKYGDYEDSIPGVASLRSEKGKIFVEGRSCWVNVQRLLELPLTNRVACHWLYRSAYVAITPGAFDEESLFHAIADSLGATWSSNKSGLRIDFNAKEHRQLAVSTFKSTSWQVVEPEIPFRKETFALASEKATDDTWTKAYRLADGSAVQEGVEPSSAVARSGMKLLMYLADNARKTKQKESLEAIRRVLDRVDREKDGRLRVNADGKVSVDFPLTDGKTWTGV